MRDKIEEALKTIDLPVEYGVGSKLDGRENADFILFNQRGIKINGMGEAFSLECIYRIIICKENYIDDELVQDVILALKDIPGLRPTSEEMRYEYLPIGETDRYVETLTLYYARTVKRFDNV